MAFRRLGAALALAAAAPHAAPPYSQLWLTFTPIAPAARAALNITSLSCGGGAAPSALLDAACAELRAGLSAMLATNLSASLGGGGGRAVVVAVDAAGPLAPLWPPQPALEGYAIASAAGALTLTAPSAQGALFGAWRLLALVQRAAPALLVPGVVEGSAPRAPLRVWNLWDNLDGTVERGYAGASVLYPLASADARRVADYARLLSSVGLNAVVLDNVNACGAGNEQLLAPGPLAALAPVAAAFYALGIHALLTPCWTSPQTVGGLNTSDPRDARVGAWWRATAQRAAAALPGFRGLLFKGDTEGQPGPNADNMTELEGANFFAGVLAPLDAIVVWRAFAHPPGGRDLPVDQAMYQFERFAGWDGAAAPNVVVQIKNGPFDFQAREPVHALFGRLPRTNVIVELEVTLEYLGQNKHAVALPPQWATYFAFDLGAPPGAAPAADTTLAGVVSRGTYSGVAGVSNLGADANWTGNILSAVNTFGFGRLAWTPSLAPARAMQEWADTTFPSSAPGATSALVALLSDTWVAYENFSASLGWGFVCGPNHYDLAPGSRVDYTNASRSRVGYARGAPGAFGSAYNGAAAAAFLSLDDCPRELLLAFHNVPYNFSLGPGRGGLTVLEWIYASHDAGAAAAAGFAAQWAALAGRLDLRAYAVGGATEADVFADVAARLRAAAADARAFADVVINYFAALTGVPPA